MAAYAPPSVWIGREDPEDGPLALRMHQLAGREDADAALIGFCCDAGVIRNKGNSGAAEGPEAIRGALGGLAAPEHARGFLDAGNVVVSGEDPGPGQSLLAERLAPLIAKYPRALVLGGGHETAYGSWQGLRLALPEARIGIINLDAHLDIRAIGTAGPSSGTPFFQIHADDPEGFDYAVLGLAPEGNTQALRARAREWDVTIVEDRDLQTAPDAAFEVIDAICARNDAIYLTVDLDVLPGSIAPGVSAPAARGVPLHVIEALIDRVRASGKLRLADIVEMSPPHDSARLTARCAALIARRLLTAD